MWSPDGSRIVFASSREKGGGVLRSQLYQKSSNGVGAAEPLLTDESYDLNIPQDWPTTGIVFGRVKLNALAVSDLWFLSMPDKKPSFIVPA